MNYAGLIYDDSTHYIDHLAPLCSLLKWPLIIHDPSISDLTKKYYPDLEVLETDKLPPSIVSCDTQPLLQAAFPHQAFKTLWLPHGNSDKGANSPFFEALQEEKAALVYGQKMIDFMHQKKVFPHPIRIGNFRWEYYLKHRPFYQKMIQLPQTGKNFLYAPTWDDSEKNNSFWQAFPHLAKSLPADCNLIIKLHPNTVKKYELELEILKGRHSKENILFLPELPPIYPILEQCHAYIGDMSSIGYDFLKFDKPLFFLNANNLPLHRCGTPIEPQTFSFAIKDTLSSQRKALYSYTFDPTPDWETLKDALRSL